MFHWSSHSIRCGCSRRSAGSRRRCEAQATWSLQVPRTAAGADGSVTRAVRDWRGRARRCRAGTKPVQPHLCGDRRRDCIAPRRGTHEPTATRARGTVMADPVPAGTAATHASAATSAPEPINAPAAATDSTSSRPSTYRPVRSARTGCGTPSPAATACTTRIRTAAKALPGMSANQDLSASPRSCAVDRSRTTGNCVAVRPTCRRS